MSGFNGQPVAIPAGTELADGQVTPQLPVNGETVSHGPQAQDAQQFVTSTVNPAEYGQLDFDGLEQVLPGEVINDIRNQAEAYAQFHIRQIQSTLDRQNQELRAENERMKTVLRNQQLRSVPPQQRPVVQAQWQMRELQQREQQIAERERMINAENARQQEINQVAARYKLDPAQLQNVRSKPELYETAARLYYAQQQQVPTHQRTIGPSGGGQPVVRQQVPQDMYSQEFDNVVEQMKRGDFRGLPPELLR